MPDQFVLDRLAGIQPILNWVHQVERRDVGKHARRGASGVQQDSLDGLTAGTLGTGDATDATSNRSGQLDVVIGYEFSPSLPSVSSGVAMTTTRLGLAESMASVIEASPTFRSSVPKPNGRTDDQPAQACQTPCGMMMTMGRSPL